MTALSEESQDRRRARTEDPEVEAESRVTERIITFSDAVIAIAITLLALALPVPGDGRNLTNGQLLHVVRADWPDYFAFLLSFVVIGNQWATHPVAFAAGGWAFALWSAISLTSRGLRRLMARGRHATGDADPGSLGNPQRQGNRAG